MRIYKAVEKVNESSLFTHDKNQPGTSYTAEKNSENSAPELAPNKKKRRRKSTPAANPPRAKKAKTDSNSQADKDSDVDSDSDSDSDSDPDPDQFDLFQTDYKDVADCCKEMDGQCYVPLFFHHEKKKGKYELVVEKRSDTKRKKRKDEKEFWLLYDKNFDENDRVVFEDQIKQSDKLRQEFHLNDDDFQDPYAMKQLDLESEIMADPSKFKCIDFSESDKKSFDTNVANANAKNKEVNLEKCMQFFNFKEVIRIIDPNIYQSYSRYVDETCQSCPPSPYTGKF